MSGKKYETINTQMECEETFHPDTHIFLWQKLIEEVPDAVEVITMQLYLKVGMKCWKGKWRSPDIYKMKQLHFRDTFKSKKYIDLNKDQNKSILESHMIFKEKRAVTIKGITMAGEKKVKGLHIQRIFQFTDCNKQICAIVLNHRCRIEKGTLL